MKILSILGQKPGMTGSGVLVAELWRCAEAAADEQRVILGGYPGDSYEGMFGDKARVIRYGSNGPGELPFPMMGMSDVMPYPSVPYSEIDDETCERHIAAYRAAMLEVIDDFEPDIIVIHHLWVLAGLANDCGDIPCLITVHGTGLKQLAVAPRLKKYVDAGIERVDRFLCVSRDIRDEARAAYGLPPGKLILMGNGYDETVFNMDGPKVATNPPSIVCAGKLVAWKGFKFAIRACAGLRGRVRLVILGAGTTRERDRLLAEAANADLGDSVIMPGHVAQSELARWFRGASLFLLPSIHEPFGMVLLEAMACGCPVVASASGGPPEIIDPGLTSAGLATLVAPLKNEGKDVDRYVAEFRAAIVKHLERRVSDEDRAEVARSVGERTWKHVYALLRETYSKVIEERPASGAPPAE